MSAASSAQPRRSRRSAAQRNQSSEPAPNAQNEDKELHALLSGISQPSVDAPLAGQPSFAHAQNAGIVAANQALQNGMMDASLMLSPSIAEYADADMSGLIDFGQFPEMHASDAAAVAQSIGSNPAVGNVFGNSSSVASLLQRRKVPVPNRNIPAFLNKLYSMVSDSSTNKYIHWSGDGSSFIVTNQDELARDVLPRFFKHNNFTSFIRQLNMYGFHKIPNIQQGSLLSGNQPEPLEFSNPNFQRDKPDLLCFVIRRKGTQSEELVKDGSLDMNTVIHEIAAIKRHQFTISADLQKIQRDNEAAWSETMQLRERYTKQQETIEKILRFLASVFSSNKKPAVQPAAKRRRLELTDAPLLSLAGGDPTLNLFSAAFAGANPSMNAAFPFAAQTSSETPPVQPIATPSTAADPSVLKIVDLPDSSTAPSTVHFTTTSPLSASKTAVPETISTTPAATIDQMQPATASQLLSQLAGTNATLHNVIRQAKDVEDDIDMLQDRLYDISSMVGLNSHADNLEDWNMDNLVANPSLIASGTDEDHAALVALINGHTMPSSTSAVPATTAMPISSILANMPSVSPTAPNGNHATKNASNGVQPDAHLQHLPSFSAQSPSPTGASASQLLASLAPSKSTTISSAPHHLDELEGLINLPASTGRSPKDTDNASFHDQDDIDPESFEEFFNT